MSVENDTLSKAAYSLVDGYLANEKELKHIILAPIRGVSNSDFS